MRNRVARTLMLVLGLVAAGLGGFAAPVQAAAVTPLNTLTVAVDGVAARGGQLRIELYNETTYETGGLAADTRIVRASAGTVSVTFVGLAPGYYGVYAVQDVGPRASSGQSGSRGRTLMGGTTQPFGYSRFTSPAKRPAFRDIRFPVVAGDNQTVVHLHP